MLLHKTKAPLGFVNAVKINAGHNNPKYALFVNNDIAVASGCSFVNVLLSESVINDTEFVAETTQNVVPIILE